MYPTMERKEQWTRRQQLWHGQQETKVKTGNTATAAHRCRSGKWTVNASIRFKNCWWNKPPKDLALSGEIDDPVRGHGCKKH